MPFIYCGGHPVYGGLRVFLWAVITRAGVKSRDFVTVYFSCGGVGRRSYVLTETGPPCKFSHRLKGDECTIICWSGGPRPFRCFYRDYIGGILSSFPGRLRCFVYGTPQSFPPLCVEDSLDEHIGVPAPAPFHIRFFPDDVVSKDS
ncbi:hypothetical protein EVAR_89389_1 [Eumeta japonica]|uniref:Uncharacterized protein n=1 Tax=Eumeta variegata TaxID=151549 RepID=A0A4C1XPP5_EUMVA|nr:hypothetical protein EVAR_89389_1 [Eumeta japonica]